MFAYVFRGLQGTKGKGKGKGKDDDSAGSWGMRCTTAGHQLGDAT